MPGHVDGLSEAYWLNRSGAEALDGGIVKWQGIVDGTGIDRGEADCTLCLKYPSSSCRGCPVNAETNRRGCRGSPFQSWVNHHLVEHTSMESQEFTGRRRIPGCSKCTEIAQAELDFLKGLRKEEEEPHVKID